MQVGRVAPNLLLGSQDAAADLELLRSLGVTRVLNAAAGAVPSYFRDQMVYKVQRRKAEENRSGIKKIIGSCYMQELDLLDDPSQEIDFDDTFDFIQGDDEGGSATAMATTLVHCNAGVSRAAAIAVAYLMRAAANEEEEVVLTVEEATRRVREARPATRPNQGFVRQLEKYEEKLRRKRRRKE